MSGGRGAGRSGKRYRVYMVPVVSGGELLD